MKFKVLFLLITVGLSSLLSNGQRGVRIGYIDTEYILENVPEYQEATAQLDKKVLSWKSEIEQKLSAIEQKKKELDNESVLLTKELYEERYEDITYEEAQILDYQQKRFGPNGDLFIQKRQLMQPVQDQIFSAVQEIAENKKFDFIFDKSADVVMLYSAEQYDVSDQVLRLITRTSKRKQASSKKERQELEEEEVVPEVNEEKDARLQALEDKKASREKELADKRAEREKALEERRKQQLAEREARKKAAEERRNKILESRNKKDEEPKEEPKEEVPVDSTAAKSARNAVPQPPATSKGKVKDSTIVKNTVKKDSASAKKEEPKTAAQILEEKKQKKLKEREERIKALEARKKEIIERRKKAREEKEKQIKKNDSIAKAKAGGSDDN